MLARELQLKHENIKIVFITGYERYAVEAFEIYALDYIMKPITRKDYIIQLSALCKILQIQNQLFLK